MIKLKELENHFKYGKFDNKIILYHPTEKGKRSPSKYVGHIEKVKSGCYKVPGGEPRTNLTSLLGDIKLYQENMFKYDSEYYNPCFRNGVFEELVIHDWLDEHGFDHADTHGDTCVYTSNKKNLYGLGRDKTMLIIVGLDSFNYHNTTLPETVKVSLTTGDDYYSGVSSTCKRNVEDIIECISSILKPMLLTNASTDLNASINLDFTNLRTMLYKINVAEFSKTEKSIKDEIIKELRNTLQKLECE